jgi:hypothetical protein
MLSHYETKLNLFVTFSVNPQYQILSKSVQYFQGRNWGVDKPPLYAVTLYTLCHRYLKLEVMEFSVVLTF